MMFGRARRRLTSSLSYKGWLPIVHRAPPSGNHIALTFDDGPCPETTPDILKLLRDHGVHATFFLCGQRVAANPALTAAIVTERHNVYSHGYSHVRIDTLVDEDALAEMARTEALLSKFRPTPSPYLVRLPYGSGHRDRRVHRLLRRWRQDCQIAHWSYNFEDFLLAEDCMSLDQLELRCQQVVDRALACRNFHGSAVLLHENPIGAKGNLVPKIAAIMLQKLLSSTARKGISIADFTPRRHHTLFQSCVRTVSID